MTLNENESEKREIGYRAILVERDRQIVEQQAEIERLWAELADLNQLYDELRQECQSETDRAEAAEAENERLRKLIVDLIRVSSQSSWAHLPEDADCDCKQCVLSNAAEAAGGEPGRDRATENCREWVDEGQRRRPPGDRTADGETGRGEEEDC